jgi:hypothetical protein
VDDSVIEVPAGGVVVDEVTVTVGVLLVAFSVTGVAVDVA